MKQKTHRITAIVLVVIWMVTVFMFSNATPTESTGTSVGLTTWLIRLFNPKITQDKLELMVGYINPMIRKVAHLTLYVLGGILITNVIEMYKVKLEYTTTLSFLCGVAYAITDEFHQLFIPGRSGELMDVGIDTMGVVIGMCVMYLIIEIRSRIVSSEGRIS